MRVKALGWFLLEICRFLDLELGQGSVEEKEGLVETMAESGEFE